MFSMSQTFSPNNAALRSHLFFPNGRAFDTLDVFLGAILLHSLHVSFNGAGATLLTPGVLTVYDGRVLAPAAPMPAHTPVLGGTLATNGTLDAWRVIAGGTIATDNYGQPYVLNLAAGAVPVQISGQRKALEPLTFNLTTGINEKLIEFPEPLRCDGAVVQFDTTVLTSPVTLAINFTPLANGAARRRLSYLPGSTVKRPNLQTAGGPLL